MLAGVQQVQQVQQVPNVLAALAGRGLTLAVAEGDTGGVLLAALTARPGSSAVVLGGVVAYHDGLKRDVLGVAPELIEAHGAVSAEVARAMADGVRRVSTADLGVATTGIAGPGGGRPGKPVGLVFVAAVDGARTLVRSYVWSGDRDGNRTASAVAACRLVLELLSAPDGD